MDFSLRDPKSRLASVRRESRPPDIEKVAEDADDDDLHRQSVTFDAVVGLLALIAITVALGTAAIRWHSSAGARSESQCPSGTSAPMQCTVAR